LVDHIFILCSSVYYISSMGHPIATFRARILVVAALLVFFALAIDTARQKSPTNDEPVHLVRSAAIWQTGDLRLQYEHTPLSHWLIGLLLLVEPTIPDLATLPGWTNGDRLQLADAFLWRSGVHVNRVMFLGRMGIIWIALLAGAILARWAMTAARALRPGKMPVVLGSALVLFAFSPNFLASAALATTDMAAAATYLATLFAWWYYGQRPGWERWLLTGICLGLALAAKLTGALLVPLLLLLTLFDQGRTRRRPWLAWFGLLPVAGLVVWAIYGFEIGPMPGGELSVPAPAYWQSWRDVFRHVGGGHPAFFLGNVSSEGWWLYFPVAFLIKTPITTLALVLLVLLWIIRRGRDSRLSNRRLPMADRGILACGRRPATGGSDRDGLVGGQLGRFLAFTLLGAATAFGAAVASRLNIGYRHILPALPLLWLLAAVVVAPWLSAPRPGRWVLAVGLTWMALTGVRQHPHHLAFFNELVGGSRQGHRYLGDSNLDWGQDLRLLADSAARYQAETGREMFYSYGGTADPAFYGLGQSSLTGVNGLGASTFAPANPAEGRYAISASHWQGLLPEGDLFDWFRRQQPVATPGYSILVYEVGKPAAGEWIAHCLAPAAFLSAEEAEQLVGLRDLRHVVFDCRQSWVFPADGAAGWYILPLDNTTNWLTDHAAEGTLEAVYRHRPTARAPGYIVYYRPANLNAADTISFEGTVVQRLPDGETAVLPAAAGAFLSLQGYHQARDEWWTLWTVQSAAGQQPLSLLAHLYEGSATPLVADGLGYTAEQWQPGDDFIQRHTFPGAAGAGYLETGVYNYVAQEAAGPRLRLSPNDS
jgi:hypothetical protein